ncbi:MAG: DUF2141 domain-containing protein [Bacteroidota bacterium]
MIKRALLLILLVSAIFSSNKTWAQHELKVTIKNYDNEEGSFMVAIFSAKEDFLKRDYISKKVKVEPGQSTSVYFENIPSGYYAVSIFHDENENGKLDKNFVGIPKEDFGFSNNARARFGPPDFDEAKVMVAADTSLEVEMRGIL